MNVTNIIETDCLDFSYGRNRILDNISLMVPEGSIYGLLGRNGAGKSTLIKLLLGLLPVENGKIKLFGRSDYNSSVFYRIGCMIESPAYYEYLTVEEHFKMFNILFKQDPKRIDETLETVGMIRERHKKAGKLSSGLKQRLAIAIALFRNPDILILDEPVNGLDPVGIIEVRELLIELQKRGKTILLSSHIISEMEKLCSHIGIIERGKIRYQGSIDELPGRKIEDFYISLIQEK